MYWNLYFWFLCIFPLCIFIPSNVFDVNSQNGHFSAREELCWFGQGLKLCLSNALAWWMSNACRNSALFWSSSGLMPVLFRKCCSLRSMFTHCCMLSGKGSIWFRISWTPWHSNTRWDSVLFCIPHIGHILTGKDVRFPSPASPNLNLVRIFLPFMLDR